MPTDWIVYACLAIGIASLLVAGVFQAFSELIMRALTATRPAGGMEAMQHINRMVMRTSFIGMFMGLMPAAAGLALVASVRGPGGDWVLAGAIIYAVTVFGVTAAGNVPMNQALDSLDPDSASGHAYWRRYGVRWTRLNHVRTIGAIVAGLCFLLAAVAAA